MSRGTDKLSLLLGCKMIRLSLESSRLQAAQRDALNAEHSNIRGNLNIDTMVQFLNSKSLLTSDESYWLMDTNRPWGKRVDFLVEILPRKERNWWDKFLWCLDESSARPGLAVHKELANQLRDQLNQQTIKYERCNLMWLLIKCMKRFTVRHQKTAFKIGTIIALLVVALCILLRSNTLIINNEISADNISESLLMSGTRHTTHKFVSNCSDKVDVVTDSSVKDDTTLHKDATQNFMSTNDSQSANLNKAHNSEKAESRPNNNSTSHKLVTSQKSSNERSITIQNTSEYAVAPEVSVGRVYHLKNLTTAPPNDKKVMQKQLNMTHCLLYYIEKEKLEYAELDLWRVYIALNAIPPNVTTTTETHLLSVIEGLTAWNIADLTIRNSIANRLASTKQTIDKLKNLLSMTDITMMRVAQYGCKLDHHVMLEQLVKNYETENTLLNLKHELHVLRPTVVSTSYTKVLAPFLYYPMLERYVSLAVDMLSAKKTCLKVCNFV